MTTAATGQVDIPIAAKLACCGSIEIVQAVLDGRLTRKAQITGERGYMSVLLNIEEVRALVSGADLGGLTSQALADRLRVADKVTRKLIAGGHLRTITAINPVNRCPVVIVPTEDIERFEAEFVTLFTLARQPGRHFRKVKQELNAAGVEPAIERDEVGATFYRS